MQVEAKFKIMWANHGDDISNQYAGTGALKSGFTRTGKRTYGGLLDDGIKSLSRYYLNNFTDGRKQDAYDLITGTYQINKGDSPVQRPGLWHEAGLDACKRVSLRPMERLTSTAAIMEPCRMLSFPGRGCSF